MARATKRNSNITGTAGVYYVMYRMAEHGYHAACTVGNAPAVDILASSVDGLTSIAIQVKTTEYASRTKGRGAQKALSELQFPLGLRCAKLNSERVIIAFVDLHPPDAPAGHCDLYLVPSSVVFEHCSTWCDDVPMVRFHRDRDDMRNRFLENWTLVDSLLAPRVT